MTGQHFRELIDSVSLTTGLTKQKICILIGFSNQSILVWQRNGLPERRKRQVVSALKEVLFNG